MADNTVIHSIEFTGDASKLQDACNKASQAVRGLGDSMSNNENKVKSFSQSLTKLGSNLSSIGTSLTIGFTAPMLLLGKQLFTTTANIEQIAVSFKVFTGSAKIAKEMLADLKEQAINSPMQFQDIAKGAQTLLGYGLTAQQVIPLSRMLGDVSSGNADKFARLALAFGQVNAAGRLMSQEARQMINAGFNPLQALAEKTGESMASLTKRMHDGQISVKEVGDAFIYATSEGGRFFNSAVEQSKTLGGSFSKLKESVSLALAEIGDSINKELNVGAGIRAFAGFINELKNRFLALTPEAKELNLKLIAIGISIGPILLGIGKIISLVDKLSTSMKLLSISGGGIAKILLTLALVFGATQVAGAMYNKVMDDAVKKDPNLLRDRNEELKEQIKLYNELIKKAPEAGFNPSGGQAEGTWVKGKRELIAERFKLYKQYTDNVFLIQKLEKNVKKDDKLDGLSTTTPGSEASSMTKAEKAKYDKLAEQARLGYTNVNNQVRLFSESKLEMFDRYAKEELDKLRALGLSTYRVEQSQFVERKKLVQQETAQLSQLVSKNTTPEGLKNSLAKMVDAQTKAIKKVFKSIDESIKENKIDAEDFIPTLDSTKFDFAINKFVNNDNINKIQNYTNALSSSLQDFGVNVFAGFANIAGSALAGVNTFADAISMVGSMFLNLVGDLLIQMGTSAIKLGITAETIGNILKTIGLPGGGLAAIAAGTLAVAAGSILKGMASKTDSAITAKSSGGQVSVKSGGSSGMATGSAYSYGGSSYSNQSIRLAIDLTGSITSTQTGYQINKSLETVLRVTGR